MHLKFFITAIFLVMIIVLSATTVQAKPTEEATLYCGSQQYTVSGFGRGEVLHVSGSNLNYVVTYARVEPNGPVVIDIKGQQDKTDVVTCTVTTPFGTTFTFKGFFTP